MRMMLLMFMAVSGSATVASAHVSQESATDDGTELGTWWTMSDITWDVRGFGYAPADIVSTDGDVRVKGKDLQQQRSEFRFRWIIHGEYFHLEAVPYTAVPEPEGGGYKVSLAGLELNLLAVVRDWLRVGLYHHSAHNFSLEDHGQGIDLNAVVVDAEVHRGDISLLHKGKYRLRTTLHYYATDKGSPYVITEDTNVDASKIGSIKWRLSTDISAYDANDNTGMCRVSFAATSSSISSFTGECDALWSPGSKFFGVLGEHFTIGPYIRYGQNIQRAKRFGNNVVVGGIRMRFLAFENHEDLKFR